MYEILIHKYEVKSILSIGKTNFHNYKSLSIYIISESLHIYAENIIRKRNPIIDIPRK